VARLPVALALMAATNNICFQVNYALTSGIHHSDLEPLMEKRPMRKLIIALMISAALIVSGISATTFSSGPFTSSACADGGD
jgi:hypothetical protein